jgi:uncharacterized membrane protein
MADLPWFMVSGIILITIIILGVFLIWRMIRELRSGFPLTDERTRLIRGKAATFAFYIGSYFMIALMFANLLSLEYRGNPILDTGYALVTSILVQSLTYIVFHTYYNREEGA